MTGALLGVIISFCQVTSRSPSLCIKKNFECAFVNEAYSVEEAKASQVVTQCLIREIHDTRTKSGH